MATRTHDPLSCHDGDGCKDCQIAANNARLKELVSKVKVDDSRKTQVLKQLVKNHQKALKS